MTFFIVFSFSYYKNIAMYNGKVNILSTAPTFPFTNLMPFMSGFAFNIVDNDFALY